MKGQCKGVVGALDRLKSQKVYFNSGPGDVQRKYN